MIFWCYEEIFKQNISIHIVITFTFRPCFKPVKTSMSRFVEFDSCNLILAPLWISSRRLSCGTLSSRCLKRIICLRLCTRGCAPTSSAPTLRRTCWVGSELSVSRPPWSRTASWTGAAMFVLIHSTADTSNAHLLELCCIVLYVCACVLCICIYFLTPIRRCSSYQDFTKIGGSSESMDLPRPPSDDDSPYQKHRHISRTLSEPSRLTGGRAGPSQSETRGRRSQRDSRFLSPLES